MEWLDHTREGFYLNEHPLGELVIVRNLSNAYDCEGADELSEEQDLRNLRGRIGRLDRRFTVPPLDL